MPYRQQKYISSYLIITCCLLAMILSACDVFGGGTSTPSAHLMKAPLNKQTYTIPEVGLPNMDLDTLDPALAHDPASTSAIQMIYTGLTTLDDHLQVQPQLAQSWHLESDGLTWTFHLKPNLHFSDGSQLTSADVAYSIDRALQPTTQSTVAPNYLKILKDADRLLAGHINTLINDSILTPDPNTVVLITAQKAVYFPAILTNTCSYVVEQSLIKTYPTSFTDHLDEGGGAGPFKVGSYKHHVNITFVPNPHYYGKKPQLQKVTFAFYRTPDEAYQDYQNALLDMTAVPTARLAGDSKHKDFVQVPQLWTNYYTMNYLAKPFDNIEIRQAFALAIDKAAIARDVWKNTIIPTNHIVPQGMDGYNSALTAPDGSKSVTGNASRARELLQKGLLAEGLTKPTDLPAITLTYVSGVSSFDQEVQELVQMWHKVLNVTVTPDPISDYQTLLDKVTASTNNASGLQMWGLAWVAEYPDPHDWLTLQFGRGATNNNMNYGQNTSSRAAQQQVIQQQLEDADGTTTASTRLHLYQQAEQQLVNDVAWLPIGQVTNTFLRNPAIVGIVDNGQNSIPPDDWSQIYRVQ